MAVERGQATVETAALWGLVALLLLVVAALLGPGLARQRSCGRSARALPHAARELPLDARRARAAQSAAARADRPRPAPPRARARHHGRRRRGAGLDELPPRRSARAPGGAEPVLHVHVVHTARRARRRALDVLPGLADEPPAAGRAARLPPRRLGGPVRRVLRPTARCAAPAPPRTAASTARAPWWEQAADDWAPYAGVVYRASGSHALGFRRSDLDLAGDAWNGDLATVEPGAFRLVAADRVALRGLVFDPEVAPPWDKAAWRNPGTRHTSAAGAGPSRMAEAARVWAQAYALGAW